MRTEDVKRPNIWKCTVVLLFLFAFQNVSQAANHYVWCGASGGKTGADFTNAYKDLPSSLTRGDTYYVAGDPTCTYGPHTFNDTESVNSVISVIKVTSTQSGVAGYTSAMATNPATFKVATKADPETFSFPEWPICNSYYTIDGVTGSVDPVAGPGGQGFVLSSSGYIPQGHVYISTNTCASGTAKTFTNITIHHVEIRTNGTDTYQPVTVTGCSYAGGNATITTNTPGWSQGWVQNDYVTGSSTPPSGSLVFGSTQISAVSGNQITVPLASSPCASLFAVELDTGGGGIGGDAIYAPGGGPNSFVNLDIQYNYLHDAGFNNITLFNANGQGSGDVIAHNFFTGNMGWTGAHGQPIQTNATSGLTVAYNVFFNSLGTAIVFNNGVSNVNGTSQNMAVYGNLVYNTGTNLYNTGVGEFIEAYSVDGTCALGSAPITNLYVYNNTIAGNNTANGVYASASGIERDTYSCSTGWVAEDNLWWNSSVADLSYANLTHSYNTVAQGTVGWGAGAGTGDSQYASGCSGNGPFSNVSTNNYQLSSETVSGCAHLNDGTSLSSPYNVDILGVQRGLDGTWERGAFEFNTGAPTKPESPTNLTATVD